MATPSPPTPLSLSLSFDTLFSSSTPSPSLSFPPLSFPSLSLHKTHLHSLPPPSPPTPFLDPTSLLRLRALDSFRHLHRFPHGQLEVRPMGPHEAVAASDILAASFSDSTLMPAGYARLIAFLVRQYVTDRRALLPHAVMLVGFYTEEGAETAEMACTAEISFDARGANAAPPTPSPPRNSPYICNMTVKKSLRR